jgi:serine/threonine-protein kinase
VDGYLFYIRQKTLYAAAMSLSRFELTSPVVPVLENVASLETIGRALLDVSGSGMLVYTDRTLLRQTLAWLDVMGGTESLLLLQPDEYVQQPRISPDQTRLAFAMRFTGDLELWSRDLKRGSSTRLTFAQGADTDPVWSPDGHYLAIASERHGGPPNMYWMRSDGSGEIVRLTTSPNGQRPRSFSSDGSRLLYEEINPPNGRDLWVLTLDHVNSGRPAVVGAEPLVQTPFDESNGVFSPDGAWVAYESTESGHRNVYVRGFGDRGGKWAISADGGTRPVWSARQSELFYLTRQGIMVVSYTANGSTFNAGNPRMCAKATIEDYDVVHSGKRFVVVKSETPRQTSPRQLRFVLNFVSEVRRRIDAVQ